METSFDNYVASNDAKSIEELFKIFPIIHENDMGIRKYGAYLASKIGEKAKDQLALAATGDSFNKPNVHVGLITQLLELVAQAIQSNETVIQQSYGPDNLLMFIQIMQCQCDEQAELIFSSFKEKRDLQILLQRARQELLVNTRTSSASSTNLNGQNKEKSLCEYCLSTEPVISDAVVFNARIELYLNFLRRRLLVSANVFLVHIYDLERFINIHPQVGISKSVLFFYFISFYFILFLSSLHLVCKYNLAHFYLW